MRALRKERPHGPQVFVLGVQKSGTTAIAALLAELTDRKLTSDFTHEDAADYRTRVFDRDIPFADLVRRHKRQFGGEIVKDPNLSFFLDELRSAFPAARLVFISRDPREQVRSLLDWMGLPGDRDEVDAVSEPALARHENRRMLLEGRWPRVEGRNYVERLAARWRVAAKLFLSRRDDVQLIRYEDFLADKAGALTDLARRLGLEPATDITGRLDIQFQPGGTPRPWLEVFGQPNLKLIENACAAEMAALRYERSIDL